MAAAPKDFGAAVFSTQNANTVLAEGSFVLRTAQSPAIGAGENAIPLARN